FRPDGKVLASAGWEGKIVLWDLAPVSLPPRLLRVLPAASDPGSARLAFDPAGKVLASCGHEKEVRLWDPDTGKALGPLPHSGNVDSVAFAPDGGQLLTGGWDGQVRLWDVARRQVVWTVAGQSGAVRGVAFHPGGGRVATAGTDALVRTWDAQTGADLHTLRG